MSFILIQYLHFSQDVWGRFSKNEALLQQVAPKYSHKRRTWKKQEKKGNPKINLQKRTKKS